MRAMYMQGIHARNSFFFMGGGLYPTEVNTTPIWLTRKKTEKKNLFYDLVFNGLLDLYDILTHATLHPCTKQGEQNKS